MNNQYSGTVIGGVLNLRQAPSTSAKRLAQIPSGTHLSITNFNPSGLWYITNYNGYSGYVMKEFVSVSSSAATWRYGQVNVNELNVRRRPLISAARWNNVWPRGRIILIKDANAEWYESLYRGQAAYIAKEFITILNTRVHDDIVQRMMFMAAAELHRNDAKYFNGYTGEWCHRFADWLLLNAGMPCEMIPNTSNCGKGIVWFINNQHSSGFFFKNPSHKARFINKYDSVKHLAPVLSVAENIYVPSPGDYLYLRWNNAPNQISVSHVCIVASVKGNHLTTWEGNSGNKVATRTYELIDDRIVGYGKPCYSFESQ